MPSRKAKSETDRAEAPPAGAPQQDQRGEQASAGASTNGLSGRGAGSVLVHLIEQEKLRDRKQERS